MTNLYRPNGSSRNVYVPLAEVTAWRSSLVSRFSKFKPASGTTAPVGSTTVTVTEPPVDCASIRETAGPARNRQSSKAMENQPRVHFDILLSPLSCEVV